MSDFFKRLKGVFDCIKRNQAYIEMEYVDKGMSDIQMYNMLLAEKYRKASRGEDLCYFLYLFNYSIALAFQGRIKELLYLYDEDIAVSRSELFQMFMGDHKIELMDIARRVDMIDSQDMDDPILYESVGEYNNRKIGENAGMIEVYKRLNGLDFMGFYHEQIAPELKV